MSDTIDKEKYTSGPWHIHVGNTYYHIEVDVDDSKGVQIAAVSNNANAYLIAAAPELLEALREMTADLVSHASFGLNEREVAMLRRAEAAIAKVKGRQ